MSSRVSAVMVLAALVFFCPLRAHAGEKDYKLEPELVKSGPLFDIYYQESRFWGTYKAKWFVENKTDIEFYLRIIDAKYNCTGGTQAKTHYFSKKLRPGQRVSHMKDAVCLDEKLKGKEFLNITFDQPELGYSLPNKLDCGGVEKSVAYENIAEGVFRIKSNDGSVVTINAREATSKEPVKVKEGDKEKTVTKGEVRLKEIAGLMKESFCGSSASGNALEKIEKFIKRTVYEHIKRVDDKDYCVKHPDKFPCNQKRGPNLGVRG